MAQNKRKNENREGFIFSTRTINNLKALIDMGLARNKTEAIDIALEHIVTEEKTKQTFVKIEAPTGICTEMADLFGGNISNISSI